MLEYDGEVPLEQVDQKLWDALVQLEPFGMGNPTPVFVARGARVLQPPKILKEKHLKFKLGGDPTLRGLRWHPREGHPAVRAMDGLAWRMAERLSECAISVGDRLDVAFTVDRNTHPEFGGGLQLQVCDFLSVGAAVVA